MKWLHLRYEYYSCVDDEDYEKISKYLWRFARHGYARCDELDDISLHRFLLGDEGECIDHINRAPWDNRRCNLRIATFSENRMNYGIPDKPPFPTKAEKRFAKKQRIELQKSRKNLSNAAKNNQNWRSRERAVKRSDGKVFDSIAKAARDLGNERDQANILACCNGYRKTCRGFGWSFL